MRRSASPNRPQSLFPARSLRREFVVRIGPPEGVYKVDRLTRALSDFAKLVEVFDRRGVSFVSITQQFNTTTSMGRLTLNVLLSFAQFEREVTGERIRDKIAASKKKGMWMGGMPPLGFDVKTASSSSTTPRPTLLSISTGVILHSNRFTPCGKSLRTPGSGASAACGPTVPNMGARSSHVGRFI